MPLSPSSAVEAGLHSVVVGGGLFLFGFLITGLLTARFDLSITSRLALAVPGLIFFVTAAMVVHVLNGGNVLSRPGIVRAVTGVAAVLLIIKSLRDRSARPGLWRDRDVKVALALVILGLVVWCGPVFTNLPVSFHGDVKRHVAWAAQLSAGDATPTAVITGDVPNYYPWLFHALVSFTASFTPGGRALHALGPLQVLAVVGSVLAFFGAAMALFGSRIAAAAGAMLGAVAGGFGFVMARAPALVVDPRVEADVFRFNGDFMMLRSYNLAFHNLAPPFPRDFGFLLLICMALLVVTGVKQRRAPPFVGAGVVLGLIGLITGESFVVGALAAAAVIAIGPGIPRWRALLAVFGPALGLYALWLVPVAINYVKLGGFADTSGEAVTLPAHMILSSWGISTPLAVVGASMWRRWPSVALRVVAGLGIAALSAVMVAGFVPMIGEGFTTLARHHRYWPLVYVGIALSGAVGAEYVLRRLAVVHRGLAIAGAIVLVGSAIASPLLAGVAFSRQPVENRDVAEALRGDRSNVLNVLGETRGVCQVAVPNELSRSVPAYTGSRLVFFPASTRNQAGIRWPTIPDAIPDDARAAANRVLLGSDGNDERWVEAVRTFGVDRIVVPAANTLPSSASDVPRSAARGEHGAYVILNTGDCS